MRKVILSSALAVLMISFHLGALAQEAERVNKTDVIRIDDLTIGETEFEAIFRTAVRQKYYHGSVPPDELEKFKRRVAQDIVDQVLVHRDALVRGLQPDYETIAEEISDYDAKYANNPDWQSQRERVIPQLTRRLERQNLLEKMEAKIKKIPQPQVDQVAEYYRNHPQKFTEPERVWGSVILLAVPPSAGEKMWSEAEDVALQLKFRVENGEDFATLAKKYSGHPSAVNGGDLGYLHQGMLDSGVQEKVEALVVNQITDPIRVLEGLILFRLNGVQEGKLKIFDEVKQRATGLLYRELQDKAWDKYVSKLKASANIYVNEKLYVQSNYE